MGHHRIPVDLVSNNLLRKHVRPHRNADYSRKEHEKQSIFIGMNEVHFTKRPDQVKCKLERSTPVQLEVYAPPIELSESDTFPARTRKM